MTKYICIKSLTKAVPVGTELVGKFHSSRRFILTEDSKLKNMSGTGPRWHKGDQLPLTGALWVWRYQDPNEALERFEAAVYALSIYQSDILNYGDSDKSFDEVYSEYKSAKAELLKRLS